jgi:hypothetical protein
MRFMVLGMLNEQRLKEQGWVPKPEAYEAMMKYNEELTKAGVLIEIGGLHPTDKGARVTFEGGGKVSVVDGPFTEAREVIGGYSIWQVKSKEEAIEWLRRFPGEAGGVVELRQVLEAADFGPQNENNPTAKRVVAALKDNKK